MKKFELLKTECEEGILTITLNNPEKSNVLTTKSIDELRDAIQEVYDNSEIKGVIIVGAGEKAFAAGVDVREIAKLNELNGRKFSENGQEAFALIESCHKPILAAVNGYALGEGCGLALACHLRIASENAVFGLPEASIGIIPGFGGTQRLTQLIGKAKALELMMTAEKLTAAEAQQIGLVNYVVNTREALIAKSKDILEKIMANGPVAVGMLINCVNATCNPSENGYQTEANSFANCCKTEDFKEGSTAFLEKRKPQFKGS
ncbi:MAG: enoyl-CoA hydratase/isomerase family protein [Cytophagales bacterium]|nr:enoyl-CoA hydratase/isomerase family protein [Cytophagales bacterium]